MEQKKVMDEQAHCKQLQQELSLTLEQREAANREIRLLMNRHYANVNENLQGGANGSSCARRDASKS